MTRGLYRLHASGQSHFLTFSCYQRRAKFGAPAAFDLFIICLENMRQRFRIRVYGYVVMPEHVHLLVSEPEHENLAAAMHSLKLSFTKRANHANSESGPFWQKRYYDRNVRDELEFVEKLQYIHRNPVRRGLVREAAEWKWSSFRHYALREVLPVEIESEWAARNRENEPGAARVFLSPG